MSKSFEIFFPIQIESSFPENNLYFNRSIFRIYIECLLEFSVAVSVCLAVIESLRQKWVVDNRLGDVSLFDY